MTHEQLLRAYLAARREIDRLRVENERLVRELEAANALLSGSS